MTADDADGETLARPVMYVIACGARPAADLPPFVTDLHGRGWRVCVLVTPSGLKFIDKEELTALTGYPVRSDYKQPDEPDVLPPPNAIVVAPATFNTVNKWAGGISDTLALGILNEALGLGIPIVAVPTPNVALARHPAFRASIQRLRAEGVRLVFDPSRYPLPDPNMGAPAADLFPWDALRHAVAEVKAALDREDGAPAVP